MLKDIVEVKPLDGYRVYLRFEDGVSGELDLSTIIRFEGVFKPVKDRDYFASVSVNQSSGTICWPNGADLDPDVLYSAVTGEAIVISEQDSPSNQKEIYSSVKDIERLYKGLADENRLKIIFILTELGEASVRDIQQVLLIPQPTVSRHLGLLKRMGLIDNCRRGQWNYYFIVKTQSDVVKSLVNLMKSPSSYRRVFKDEIKALAKKRLARVNAVH